MEELYIKSQTIRNLFSDKKFIIPEFQRPYEWDVDKCDVLWNDIVNFFTETHNNKDTKSKYFLGTIVYYYYSDKEEKFQIIDGQQRITSLMLLLRAFYKKLEEMELIVEDKDISSLKMQIAPCIWDVDPVSKLPDNKEPIHLESRVITDEEKDNLLKILQEGEAQNTNSNYSKNYSYFIGKCNEYAKDNPMNWKNLCVTILDRCILLPIQCNNQNTALVIFSTLNDRGLPLADSDIFKAEIYKRITDKEEFIENWKELTKICQDGGFSIDDIFRYYMHVLRGRNKDKSREIGLRKFYSENNYEKLYKRYYKKSKNEDEDPNKNLKKLMSEITNLARFWKTISKVHNNTNISNNSDNTVTAINSYESLLTIQAKKYLHCLEHYPNDLWKYPVSVFFTEHHKDNPNFKSEFEKMLQKLVAYVFAKFIYKQTKDAIKDEIYSACIALSENKEYSYRFEESLELEKQIDNLTSSKIEKALLLLHAYLHPEQKDPIPDDFEIEHILPKKWQSNNYNGWDKKDAEQYLEKFGNKVVIEDKLNIQAGNNYFGKKKEKYRVSKIQRVLDLSKHPEDNWLKENIEAREKDFVDTLSNYFKENLG